MSEYVTVEDARRTGLYYGEADAKRDSERGQENALRMLQETVTWVTSHLDDSDEHHGKVREESYLLAYVTTWARLEGERK